MARVDSWLWAVRIYKTRTMASDACKGGHVRVNGRPAKPAQDVKPGDRVVVRSPGWDREFQVVETLTKRVGAALAAKAYIDHSPERPVHLSAPVARRDRGAGRPTKKERREIDALRGRW